MPAAATVTAALATPLMAHLAQTVYRDALQHDPAELLDASRFPTAEAIEDHLLGVFVPAVYRQADPTQTNHPRRRPRDDAADAHRWHIFLATHLHRLGTQDLAWWQLRDAVPRTARVLTLMLVCGPVFGLMLGSMHGLVAGISSGIAFGLLCGLVSGLEVSGPQPLPTPFRLRLKADRPRRRRTQSRLQLRDLVPALLMVLARNAKRLAVAPAAGLATGLAAGLAFGILFGIVGLWLMLVVLMLADGKTIQDAITLPIPVAFLPVLLLPYSAWGHWLIFPRLWLPATGKLPWAVMGFLVDAHRRGVLRQAGGAYQYRHARLRDRLASRTPS
jgi:hypothetical protein